MSKAFRVAGKTPVIVVGVEGQIDRDFGYFLLDKIPDGFEKDKDGLPDKDRPKTKDSPYLLSLMTLVQNKILVFEEAPKDKITMLSDGSKIPQKKGALKQIDLSDRVLPITPEATPKGLIDVLSKG